jgi:heme/copper-type cytochrome/quinol oxidase subunit 2
MTIKEIHVFTPIILLAVIGFGTLILSHLRIPLIVAWLTLQAMVSVWVYFDSRALNQRYPSEWERAELGSPFWIGVTTLLFAPLGLAFYTYELRALNSVLKAA